MNSPFAERRLIFPPQPPRFVPRPRLTAALDAADGQALTLVAAGPGSGKTVLLSDWARGLSSPIAWIALTPADDEPANFQRLLIAALRGSGTAPDDLPVPRATTGIADLLESLFFHLPATGNPLVLVLDDAHVLHHPGILESLDMVVQGRPAGLRLVIAARSDPLLPLHRYRLAGQLAELRAADLAMTAAEAHDLLAAHNVSLPAREFDLLIRRTEGWTAGLRLSALRMEGTERPAEFVAELAIDEGSIGEYLIEEVINRQPEAVRRLLIETCFLPEVTGSQARAVTGIEDAAEILAELARTNSFVCPLDHEYRRFRYHPLLTEILGYLLRRRRPALLETLFSRAAAWFEQTGDLTEALRWYVRAGDIPAAATVFVHGGLARTHVDNTDVGTTGIHELAARVGDGAVPPAIEVFRSVAALRRLDPNEALDYLGRMRTGLGEAAANKDLAVTMGLLEMRLACQAGAWTVMEGAADGLLALGESGGQVASIPGLRSSLMLAAGVSRFWQGRLDQGAACLRDALSDAERDGATQVQAEILGMIAFIDTSMSRPRRAAEARGRALDVLTSCGNIPAPVTLDLAEAARAYMAADFDAMAKVVPRINADNSIQSDAGLAGSAALIQAAILIGCGHVAEGQATLQDNPALQSRASGMIALRRAAALAGIETALGRPHGALRLLEPYEASPLADHLVVERARAYMALNDLRAARACIRGVLTSSNSSLSRYTVIEALLCEAQIAQCEDDEPRAVELLMQATDIANGDVVLPFARCADVFAKALASHPTLATRWPSPPPSPSAPTILVPSRRESPDALTERERAVLRYLSTSMSTAEIASELYLSVNTVKTHLAAIYRKLAARKRREAVLRARELELL
jgi:LuxR family maltose regulon positive regulatory protein